MSERLQMATKLKEIHARWCELTRELGASRTGDNGDRIVRELEAVEHEMRSAIVGAAAILESAERQLVIMPDLLQATSLFDDVMRCRRDGPWRDVPAFRLRWSIPEDETIEAFCERKVAEAIAKSRAVHP
jgi:hypothetical protein